MTPGAALVAALGDFYRQSWRLLLLNAGFSTTVLPLLVLSIWAPLALVPAVLVAGPATLALMHCAVTLAQTEDLSLRCALEGVRLHWRRGVVLAAGAAIVVALGVVAVDTYGRAGFWPLAALAFYLLLALLALQIPLLPLAVAEPGRPLLDVLRAAATVVLRRPVQVGVLGIALAAVNLAGAAAALLPLLTLTIAFSFLAAAHFTVPRPGPLEAQG